MNHFDPPTREALDTIANYSNSFNNFAKLSAGESKAWYFDPNSIEKITNQFKQERIRFKVFDPEVNREFIWDSPIGGARQVLPFMEKQIFFLKVERRCEGRDTRYVVSAIEPVTTAELNPDDKGLSE